MFVEGQATFFDRHEHQAFVQGGDAEVGMKASPLLSSSVPANRCGEGSGSPC